jgi:hypothetical protein
MEHINISHRITEGYTREQAAMVLGVSTPMIERWIKARWLRISLETNRITERSLANFIRSHPEQYSLKRVDEVWFKGMMFPGAFGVNLFKQPEKAASGPLEMRLMA